MNTAYFYLTEDGGQLVRRLSAAHPGDIYNKDNFKETLRSAFAKYDSLVCVMATGIVVRILAPLLVHKTSDPAVVVMDQNGAFAISLLSGHLGGANDLAREMAAISGGSAVITTATDVAGKLSFDTFAKAHNLAIQNIGQLKYISGALLSGEKVRVFTDKHYPELKKEQAEGRLLLYPVSAAKNLAAQPETIFDLNSEPTQSSALPVSLAAPNGIPEEIALSRDSVSGKIAPAHNAVFPDSLPTVIIDEGFSFPEEFSPSCPVLYLRPRTICAGIGCKRNMAQAPIEEALLLTLKKERLHPLSLKCIATIPLKSNEPGIIGTADRLHVPLQIIPTEEIEALDIGSLGIATSEFVAKQTGVLSVSTACSYLASGRGEILCDKEKYKGITIALSKIIKDID